MISLFEIEISLFEIEISLFEIEISLLNSNRDFYYDVYTIFNRIKLTIWTICAFRQLEISVFEIEISLFVNK